MQTDWPQTVELWYVLNGLGQLRVLTASLLFVRLEGSAVPRMKHQVISDNN